MKTKYLVYIIPLIVGCSPPVTYITNLNPAPLNIPDTKMVYFDHGKKITWDKILNLSFSSAFQITRMNTNEFQIQLRMVGPPETFIDCGTKRITTEGQVTTVINSASQYSYEAYRLRHLDTYNITNQFAGIANVHVTGDDSSSKALIDFELELRTSQKIVSTQGSRHSKSGLRTLIFRPNEEVMNSFFGTVCRSTGKFEKKFLDLMAMIRLTALKDLKFSVRDPSSNN